MQHKLFPWPFAFGQRIYSGLLISLGKHPLAPSSHVCTTSRDLPGGKWEEKWEKHPQTDPFWGSQENMWLWDLCGVTSPWWGVDGTWCGCCSPSCSSFGWMLTKPPWQSDLGAMVTQFCHGSVPDKTFPGPGVVLTPCCLALGTVPGGLLQLRGAQVRR